MNVVTAKIIDLNEETAKELLKKNTHNRPMKSGVVDRYVRDMQLGNWRITNQGVGVSEEGLLLDGQHRLKAFIEAGCPSGIKILLVEGLNPSVQMVVDQQTKRSARDVFALQFNARVSKNVPAVCVCLFRDATNWGSAGHPTIDEQYNIYIENCDILDAILQAPKNGIFYASSHLAGFVKAAKKSGELVKITGFMNIVEEGEGLLKNEPAFHLRNYVVAHYGAGGGHNVQKERMDKTFKATMAYLAGQEMKTLRM